MRQVKWGVLGTAQIAKGKTIPAMGMAENCIKYAIAGRDLKKAEAFQKEFGFTKAYGSYDELLEDPEVEAVYIPLPNHLHKEWTIKAAKKGKHVLCEKPMSGTLSEVEEMIQACEEAGVVYMEAFAYLHSPYIAAIKEEMKNGTIGDIRFIETVFHTTGYEDDIRIRRESYGGALYDLGCYNTSLLIHLLEREPINVTASGIFGYDHVDVVSNSTFDFGEEVRASASCSMATGGPCGSRFFVYGTKGYIEAPICFNQSGLLSYRIYQGNTFKEEKSMEIPDNYKLEIEQMQRCICEGETPWVSHEFSKSVARVDDEILKKMGYV